MSTSMGAHSSRHLAPRSRRVRTLAAGLALAMVAPASLASTAAPADAAAGRSFALSGDWNGDGRDTPGWFRDGVFLLRGAGSGGADLRINFGRAGDVPLTGDWTGDGQDTVAVVRGTTWHFRASDTSDAADLTLQCGNSGDFPIAGDWNGNGRDTIGVIRGNHWHLSNSLSCGSPDVSFRYGYGNHATERPVTGDWNGDGRDTPGIVHQGTWYLRHANGGHDADFDEPDVTFSFGPADGLPVAGSWNGRGADGVGKVDGSIWSLRNSASAGFATRVTFAPIIDASAPAPLPTPPPAPEPTPSPTPEAPAPPADPDTGKRVITHGQQLTVNDVGLNYNGVSPSSLHRHEGQFVTSRDGQVVEGLDVVNGNIFVRHRNVTVRNNRVNSNNRFHWSIQRQGDTSGLVVKGNELIAAQSGAWDWMWTARRNYIRHMPADFMKGGDVIEENYADFYVRSRGAHHDGMQVSSGSFGSVRRNYFGATYVDSFTSTTPILRGTEGLTSSVLLKPDNGPISHYRFEDNFFGSHPEMYYTFRIYNSSNITVTGNVWQRGWGAAATLIDGAPGLRWENNRDTAGNVIRP